MTVSQKRLKIALIRHGWTLVDLARETGDAIQTIRMTVAEMRPAPRVRERIENALECRIWSRPVRRSASTTVRSASHLGAKAKAAAAPVSTEAMP